MKYMHPSREASSGGLASCVRTEKNTLKHPMLFRGQGYPVADIRPTGLACNTCVDKVQAKEDGGVEIYEVL